MKPGHKKLILTLTLAVVFSGAAVLYQLADVYIQNHPLPAADPVSLTEENVGSTDSEPVRFSLDPGFYDSTKRLMLSCDGADEIVYSLDGSDPRDGGKKYRPKGINLRSGGSDVNIFTVTAAAKFPDGSYSDTVTRSYLVGAGIADRFDCLVFSVSIDPDALYNYEDGIFIEGKMRDDYLKLPAEERYPGLQPTDPANWNQRGRAGEREAHVEVFEYDGSCVISQDCGLRIFGGWSRANDQKNLRLYARSEYDEVNNRFRYEFFPDALDSEGNKIVSYKKLSLRACANDNGALYARDDAISALAKATGVEVKDSRPTAVFLNGEYYGFAWCQQVFSEDLLDHKYNVEDGSWDILKGCEYMMIEDADDPDWAAKNADWREMYDYAYKDLTDDETYRELCELIDVDNFLTYYAFNSYVGNGDWPNNNYKVFRYSSGSVEKSDEAPYDGKWRFMLYDTDFGLGLYNNDFFTQHISGLFREDFVETFPEDWRLDVHDQGDLYYKRSDLLIALCKRDDVREKFMDILCAISGYYLNFDRTSEYLDEYCELRLHELVAASEAGRANVWSASRELDTAKNWIKQRPIAARYQMANVFPENYIKDEFYTVTCEPVEGAVINLGAADITYEDGVGFDGWYFDGMKVDLGCTLSKGVEFEKWLINGQEVYEQNTVVSRELYGGKIEIALCVKKSGGIKIFRCAYKGSAGGDSVTIKNYSDKTVSTSGLTLTDGSNEFILPVMTIPAGGSVKLIGKNYSGLDALGSVEMSFNLKEGETVTLLQNGEPISALLLRPAHKRTALEFEPFTGRYIEVSSNYKTRLLEAELPTFEWGRW